MNTARVMVPQIKHCPNILASEIQIQWQSAHTAAYGTQQRPEPTVTSVWLEVNKGHQEKGPPSFFAPSFFSVTEELQQLDDFSFGKIPWRQGQPLAHHLSSLHKQEHHPATQTQALYTPAVSSGSWVHCYPSPAVSSVLSVADYEQRFPSEPESGHCMSEL